MCDRVIAANNPIMFVDPLGLAPGDWWEPIVRPIKFYNRAREIRSRLWNTGDFANDSFGRHFHASNILASEYGGEWTRIAGIVNEIQGLGRGGGSWDDLMANEAGIRAAGKNCTK